MVLSIQFYKVAKTILKGTIRPLTLEEKKELSEYIVKRNMLLSLGFTIFIGLIIATGILYLVIVTMETI